jgi:hypothetical protein
VRSLLLIAALFMPVFAEAAFTPEPILIQEEIRHFPNPSDGATEQSVNLSDRGKAVRVVYSSDVPIEMRISFPLDAHGESEDMRFNPMMTLRFPNLPQGHRQSVQLELTDSPAWSPGRTAYILHVRGPSGATVQVHDLEFLPSSFMQNIGVALRHLFLDETVQLSSINHRFGYRVLNVPVVVVVGVVLVLCAVLIFCFFRVITGRFLRASSGKAGVSREASLLFACCIAGLLLYDARFSLDLMRTGLGDLLHWFRAGEYRQLGPIHTMVDVLEDERRITSMSMTVSVCLDMDDLYFKQLRYHLAPATVVRGDHDRATHLVFIGKRHDVDEEGMLACSSDQKRPVERVAQLEEGSAIYRFIDVSLP